MPDQLQQSIGETRDYTWVIPDDDGNPIVNYGEDAALSAQVWPGDDLAVSCSPLVEWVDREAGSVKMTVSAGDTAGLNPGVYSWRALVTEANGRVSVIGKGSIEFEGGPGSALPPATYGKADDLLTYAPWLGDLPDKRSSQTGFAEPRSRARGWLEDVLHAHHRTGYSRQGRFGGAWGTPARDPWLVDQLAAGKLMVTDKIREIVARKAIAIVCESQIGPGKDNPYVALANRYGWQAEEMAKTLVAWVDADGDGIYELPIDCTTTHLRRI